MIRPKLKKGKNQRGHLQKKHLNEEKVSAALKLPKPEKDRAFDCLKKEGIFKFNKSQMKQGGVKYIRAREQGNSDLIMCGQCKGFCACVYFHRHKERCNEGESEKSGAVSIPLSLILTAKEEQSFRDCILSRFQNDEVGEICRNDVMIKTVGRKQYEKLHRKKD